MSAAIEIRETIVSPTADGLAIEIRISDTVKTDDPATFEVAIRATVPKPKTQILEGLQIAALERAWQELHRLQEVLYRQVPDQAQSFLRH